MTRLLTFLFLFGTFTVCAEGNKFVETSQDTLEPFFSTTDAFLKAHIKNGKVSYKAIKQDPVRLDQLIKMIGNVTLDDATDVEKKAFYINAYNILTINSIIENGIPSSPMDIDGFFDSTSHQVAGQQMTLDELEKGTLFPEFDDARMHFAVVCAALGCPQLQPEAYVPDKLDEQLNQATTEALNRDYFIRVNNDQKKIQVSQIFDWYRKDFLNEADSILAFINQYRNTKIPGDYGVDYYEYDWSLNDVEE